MSIEIVANYQNLFSLWEMHIDSVSADMCEINARAGVGDFHVSKPQKGGEDHKQIAHAVAFIFRIISVRFPRYHRQRRPSFLKVLFTRFIDTN